MKGTLKRVLGAVAAAALAATGFGLAAGSANAATAENAHITLTGQSDIESGRTFNAYLLGTYADPQKGTGDTVANVTVNTANGWKEVLETAITAANLDSEYQASQYNGLPAAYIASLDTTTYGSQLREIAKSLADNTSKPAATYTAETTPAISVDGATVTVPVEDANAGLYLITDSAGSPILIGSPIPVTRDKVTTYYTTLGSTELGTADLKPTSEPTPEKTATSTDLLAQNVKFDGKTVHVGQTLDFKITAQVPNTTGYTNYPLWIKDVASKGLTVHADADNLTVKIGEVELARGDENDAKDYTVTSTTDEQTGVTTTTVKLTNVADKDNQTVTVTYKATVNSDVLENESGSVSNKATVSRDGTTYGEPSPVTVHTYGFSIKKTEADGTTALAGAKFTLSAVNGETVTPLSYNEKTKAWTTAKEASVFTTPDTGVLSFQGLEAGTYQVQETQAPDGYMQSVKPTFTVTIAADGKLTVGGSDPLALVSDNADGNRTVTVKNVQNITQLPKTGAAGIAMFTVLGLLVLGAGAAIFAKSRSIRKSMMA